MGRINNPIQALSLLPYSIIKIGDTYDHILRTKCVPLTQKEILDEWEEAFYKMFLTIWTFNGVGLAAPQIGLAKRVFLVDFDNHLNALINPTLLYKSGNQIAIEACLSIPGKWGYVQRPKMVVVNYTDRLGKDRVLKAYDQFASVICHEMDHLDGVLFTSIAKEIFDVKPVSNGK